MELSMLQLSVLLMTACLTITQAQYYDFFQGIQQIFQQYPQQTQFFNTPFNNYNKPTITSNNKKKSENQDRRTKKPPTQQYDYIFATTTTPKPSRKPSKSSSSHVNKYSNKNYNTDIIFSDYFLPNFEITTKRNRVTTKATTTTTTVKPVDNYFNINKATTENVLNIYKDTNNYNSPVSENIFKNNHRNDYAVNNYETHNNLRENDQRNYDNSVPNNIRNPSMQNINLNNNKYYHNVDKPTNNRNPDVSGINLNSGTQNNKESSTTNTNNRNENKPKNNRNPDVTGISIPTQNNRENNLVRPTNHRNPSVAGISNHGTTSGFINNNNNENYNNRGSNNYNSGNPQTYRPGVKPSRVDVNQPPITNKPLTFDRPLNQGFSSNTDRPVDEPETIIGPDEDSMTERQKRRYIDIAEKMCDRYKSLNVKEVAALPLLPSAEPVEFNVTSCEPITVPLVIGGKVVSINEFPHMALVGWRKIQSAGYSWKCGASLISDQYLLTAGHCTYQDKDYDVESGPPHAVQLGSTFHDDPNAVVVKLSTIIRYPKYKQRRSYFDLALIKMARTVRFTDVIRPACLGVPPAVGENVIATGWGRTEFGGDHSEELRSVSLTVWNMTECREIWGTSLKLPVGPSPFSHMCAGERKGGKDTCQGDSGGPAQIQDGCIWRIVAVTSFGRSCGAPNTPALYSVLKLPFISAQVFGDREEELRGNQDRRKFEDRRQSIYTDRQQGFTLRPTYIVNNFKRD